MSEAKKPRDINVFLSVQHRFKEEEEKREGERERKNPLLFREMSHPFM